MIDNINKLSTNLDANKQQTAASIANLTDDGEILNHKLFFNFLALIREKKKRDS
jgi:hypothetical protein